MSPLELVAILALVGYSVYKQTQKAEVVGDGRFKMAIIYGIAGLCIGGFTAPSGVAGYSLIAASLLLSAVVGLVRGRLTNVWRAADGRIFRQGTVLTVSLFLAMIVVKFGMGAFAYFEHISDGAGFGEVLVMIAIMIAAQAEIVYRRAQRLSATATTATTDTTDTTGLPVLA